MAVCCECNGNEEKIIETEITRSVNSLNYSFLTETIWLQMDGCTGGQLDTTSHGVAMFEERDIFNLK